MRSERWYWLLAFCCLSLGIHIGLILNSRSFSAEIRMPRQAEMEVTLEPSPEPQPKLISSTPVPEPDKRVERSSLPHPESLDRGRPFLPAKRIAAVTAEHVAAAPNVEQGGMDRLRSEKPLPLGLPSARKDANAPQFERIARSAPNLGGGSPAPNVVPGGHGGSPNPESPPEDIIYHNGGAGGIHLPRTAPRMGGGGGRSILSVNNPLAKEAIPDERPGLGPGPGGGVGMGSGGGIGHSRGQGIGTRLDGREALATLRSKPGSGIGAGEGGGVGTRSPGGGRGTGAELPGTGGVGFSYGRGHGLGVGPGGGTGAGNGEGNGGPGLTRGVPFGDVSGLLHGDPNGGGGIGGGPGGRGRGGVFGVRPGRGRIHIVYLLDSSGSMRDGHKIDQAKVALKQALSELQPTDSFDIIHFDRHIYPFAPELLSATAENIRQAMNYVDDIRLNNYTVLSDALEAALAMKGVTHIYVLSDGEPNGGIEDFDELRAMVRDRNRNRIQINTLALGLGERFKGMVLLKALADDNGGSFAYINLAK